MSYQRDIQDYNKEEGHDVGNQTPGPKRGKSLLVLLLVLVLIFLFFYSKDHISDVLSNLKSEFTELVDGLGEKLKIEGEPQSDTEIEDVTIDEEITIPPLEEYLPPLEEDSLISPKNDTLIVEVTKRETVEPKISPTPKKEKVTSKQKIKLTRFSAPNGKEGLRDMQTKKVYVEPIFDAISSVGYSGSWVWKVKAGNKYGWLDEEGVTILPVEYDEIELLFEYISSEYKPYVVVKKGGKYGVFNRDTKTMILPIDYTSIKGTGSIKNKKGKTESRYFIISKPTGTGLYDIASEKIIIPLEYSSVSLSVEGCFVVSKNSLYGVVNSKNEIVAPIKYRSVPLWSGGTDNKITFKVADGVYESYDKEGNRLTND